MKKKLAKLAIVAILLVGATAPVSAISVCDLEQTSFEIWFAQTFLCH